MPHLKTFDYGHERFDIEGDVDKYGRFVFWDGLRNNYFTTWADVNNWLDDRSGYAYYDTYAEALESWNEDLPDGERWTMETLKKECPEFTVAEACGGRIEIEEDEE